MGMTAFLELLPRFELGTSSLPTAVWDGIGSSFAISGTLRWGCALLFGALFSVVSAVVFRLVGRRVGQGTVNDTVKERV